VLLCYAGTAGSTTAEADAAIEPLLELGTVIRASIAERRYAEVLEEATALPAGLRMVPRNTLVRSVDDGTIAAIARFHESPTPPGIAVRSLGGAFGRVAADATAFAHRDAEAMVVGALVVPADTSDDDVERALQPWHAVAARGLGTYIGFQGSATADDVAAAYPSPTHERLVGVKRAYDPANVFARNHNIVPSVAGQAEGPAA
jgi:hypothetical protein